MPARLPGSAFLVAPPPASRAVEQAQAKALTDWGHGTQAPSAPPPAGSPAVPPAPALREPLFGGAAQDPPFPPRSATSRAEDPSLALFQHQIGRRRTGRWLVAAVVVVAGVGLAAWVLGRRPPPTPAPEPVATAPAASEPVPASTTPPAQPDPAPVASETPPAVPALAGSPKQDAPDAEEPGEADYRAAVQAARDANAASNWDAEAEQYRRALSVHPASLEAKEGLGSAIVKSAGRAGSYLEAERLLGEVVRTDAARSRAWLVLGMARQLGARPGPAVEAYRHYLDLEPQGPMASDVRDVVRALDQRDVAQRRPGR
jgi:hypothetical protein